MKKKLSKKRASAITSVERLVHFRCVRCSKWWSIGSAPADKNIWYCPWCGKKHGK